MYYVKDITSNKQQNPLGRKVKKKKRKEKDVLDDKSTENHRAVY